MVYYIMTFMLYVSLIRMYDNDIKYGCFFLQSLNRVASFICLLLGFFLLFLLLLVSERSPRSISKEGRICFI